MKMAAVVREVDGRIKDFKKIQNIVDDIVDIPDFFMEYLGEQGINLVIRATSPLAVSQELWDKI